MIERIRPKPQASYGVGYFRMVDRLGPRRMEELRQQVLKDQLIERNFVLNGGPSPKQLRDRETYKDYPTPRHPKKLKRRK